MENKNEYNSFSLVKFVWKWRKWLLLLCVATMIISFICSMMIQPRFKSTATIYAPRTNSVAKILLNEENYNERLDIKAYAIEEETEQMMQLLNAVEIKDSLIKKYNLPEYYDIDIQKKGGLTKLYKTLTNNLTIKRTDYGAITITVTDWDPQMACNMTDDVLRLLDTVKNRTEHERATAAYMALSHQLDSINKEIQRIDDSIQVCMQHGVFDVETQSERVMQQYAIAVSQGNAAAISRLEEEQKKLAEWGPRLDAAQNLLHYFREYQSLCKQKLMDAQLDMSNAMPVKFVVDRPAPADKKCYPKKSIIMLVSTFCVLVLSIIVLLLFERIEERSDNKAEESVE
ncbi:MAG: Wzz/FepE/Etk N-terminal domain-containing protein [Bacteroidales bacterium]|nr:Wzz/FepE/Etk N-terminal domain-containing protein [Bacteroidales bacterium]